MQIPTWISEQILYIAALITAISIIVAALPKLFHWIIDKYKRQNRAWHEFLIKELYERSFIPYLILESKSLNCTLTNTAMRRLFAAGEEHFRGRAWFRLIEPSELKGVIESWREAFDNKASYTKQVNVVLPDGTRNQMIFMAEPFIFLNATRAYIVTARIIRTKRKEAEEA